MRSLLDGLEYDWIFDGDRAALGCVEAKRAKHVAHAADHLAIGEAVRLHLHGLYTAIDGDDET